ncbi:hypothetical protein [Taibaiella koreensis]|uniref:hypothetical protein n=1 Tax=Taibaiella koreensis TaxID=1268548 RepID=UPI0013C36609|nr:hypothetical protein [Taibaiella koreensis]
MTTLLQIDSVAADGLLLAYCAMFMFGYAVLSLLFLIIFSGRRLSKALFATYSFFTAAFYGAFLALCIYYFTRYPRAWDGIFKDSGYGDQLKFNLFCLVIVLGLIANIVFWVRRASRRGR